MEDIASTLAEHPWIAYAALAALVILVAALVALRPWPFPPSLTPDEINGFARLDRADPGRGAEAMSTFYGWRQDQWSLLARGLGALAVAVLLALVGATLEAGKRVTETTTGATAQAPSKKETTTDSETSPAMLALVWGFIVFGGGAWLRARALHREFSTDIGRLTGTP